MANESPLEQFKQVLTGTARALAHEPEIELAFTADAPTQAGKNFKVPMPGRLLPPDQVAEARGFADSFSLKIKHHNAARHAALRPSEVIAGAAFDAVENARVEALGSRNMAGIAANLGHALELKLRTDPISRAQSADEVPISTALSLIVRERLTGAAIPDAAVAGVDMLRGWIEEKAGSDLDALALALDDQGAFAALTQSMLEHLNLTEGDVDPSDADEGGDDAEEAVVALHDEALHIFLLLGGHLAGAIEHVFELSTFENHGLEADFSKEVAVVQRGNDHADAAGEGRVIAHDPIRPAGHVVGSRGADGVEINDHWLVGIEVPDRVVEHIGGGDLAAGRVGLDHHGLHIGIGSGLFERELEILDHGITQTALSLEGDDASERNHGDFVMRITAFFDDLLVVFTRLENFHARHRGRALGAEQREQPVGGEARVEERAPDALGRVAVDLGGVVGHGPIIAQRAETTQALEGCPSRACVRRAADQALICSSVERS